MPSRRRPTPSTSRSPSTDTPTPAARRAARPGPGPTATRPATSPTAAPGPPRPRSWCHLASDDLAFSPAPATRRARRYDARNQQVELYTPGLGATTYDPAHNYQVAAVYTPTAAGKEHQTLYGYDDRATASRRSPSACARRASARAPAATSSPRRSPTVRVRRQRQPDIGRRGRRGGRCTRHYCYDARDQLITVATATGCAAGPSRRTPSTRRATGRAPPAGRPRTPRRASCRSCSGPACAPLRRRRAPHAGSRPRRHLELPVRRREPADLGLPGVVAARVRLRPPRPDL